MGWVVSAPCIFQETLAAAAGAELQELSPGTGSWAGARAVPVPCSGVSLLTPQQEILALAPLSQPFSPAWAEPHASDMVWIVGF